MFSFLMGLSLLTTVDQQSYTGYQVIRAWPQTPHHVQYFHDAMNQDKYDFWKSPRKSGVAVDLMLQPDQISDLKSELQRLRMEYEIIIEDVQSIIQNQIQPSWNHLLRGTPKNFDFESYHSSDDINTYLDELVMKYPQVIKDEVFGHSVEGRRMRMLTLSKGGDNKRAVWIDGGLHAREWISSTVSLYVLNQLLEDQSLLDHFDFYVSPMLNPDGYEYTRSHDRLWRKNRGLNEGESCMGVDLNRNFDNHFGGPGSSSYSCSSTYRGQSPFSQPESQAIRDAIASRADRIELLVTFHSYSQVICVPYSYSVPATYPDNYQEMVELGEIGADALKKIHGTEFVVANTAEELGPGAGAQDDWAKENAGIRYVYTMELRDKGEHGFLLPADQIIPSGEESWAAVKAMCNHIIVNKSL